VYFADAINLTFSQFVIEDYWPDVVNGYVGKHKFQALNFHGMHVIRKIAKFMFLERLYEYGIL